MKVIANMEQENIFDNFTKEFVDTLNHQLDVAILECLEKNNLNPREVVLLQPREPFSGKYWFVPKRFAPKVGENVDFSKCYLICEFKLKERVNEICQNSSQKSTDLKD